MLRPSVFVTLLLVTAASVVSADEPARIVRTRDTLRVDLAAESKPAVRKMLTELIWEPADFRFSVAAPNERDRHPTDAARLIRFPSPRPNPTENAAFNTGYVEWWPAIDDRGKPLKDAPAILFLHILDNRMPISRALGRTLAPRGVHCFLLHAPGFGRRRMGPFNAADFFNNSAQAVADARRARDVIAALPNIDSKRIALAGTSLGGFLAGPAGSLDGAFNRVFIMLAGGDLHHMFTHGQNEAATVRRHLAEAGFAGDKLAAVCARVEPTTLAHRLDAKRTWMLNAEVDQVVPRRCCNRLAAAIGLAPAHHTMITGDHYLGVVHLPWVADFIEKRVRD